MELATTDLVRDLTRLGVPGGGVMVVHTAFSRVGPVAGGPLALIEALQETIGPEGTLVMPSMSDDDSTPFDPATTSCISMGIVAETFRGLPGVLRSNSPHAFAARGPHAAQIARFHPVDVPHGPDSPVGRVLELDGQVLLLGVNHDSNTTVHLAEAIAEVPYGIAKSALTRVGDVIVRTEYTETDHCCRGFLAVDQWLDERGWQRRGTVGRAKARLIRSRDLVDVVVKKLREDPMRFLCVPGQCDECDQARSHA